MTRVSILIVCLLFLSACSSEEQANSSTPSTTEVSSAQTLPTRKDAVVSTRHKLLVFVNPSGGPCIMQNNILKDMADELQGKVIIQHVQTTVSSDLKIFHHYGIRALPTIVLTDYSGKELKRTAPGVKNADTIRALLQSFTQL